MEVGALILYRGAFSFGSQPLLSGLYGPCVEISVTNRQWVGTVRVLQPSFCPSNTIAGGVVAADVCCQ